MLDDLELPQVQEVTTYDRRALAEHKSPGMDGSLLQNMGRRPTRLVLWGVTTGSEALEFVEALDGKFRAGDPVLFVADITTDTEIEQMVIDDLEWQELAGRPERFAYVLTLREYIEPVEPEDTSAVDTDVLGDVTEIMDDLTVGLEIIEELSAFVSRLTELHQALEHQGTDAAMPSP
jgi:hypothetical protein